MNIIVTGCKEAGKSYNLLRTAEKLKAASKTVGGVLSPRVMDGDETLGYDMINPGSGETTPFAFRTDKRQVAITDDMFTCCHLAFLKSAFEKGNEWIRAGMACDVLFIDEIGVLELSAKSEYKRWDFAPPLTAGGAASGAASGGKKQTLIYSVKEKLLDKFIEKYNYDWKIYKIESRVDISGDLVAEICHA